MRNAARRLLLVLSALTVFGSTPIQAQLPNQLPTRLPRVRMKVPLPEVDPPSSPEWVYGKRTRSRINGPKCSSPELTRLIENLLNDKSLVFLKPNLTTKREPDSLPGIWDQLNSFKLVLFQAVKSGKPCKVAIDTGCGESDFPRYFLFLIREKTFIYINIDRTGTECEAADSDSVEIGYFENNDTRNGAFVRIDGKTYPADAALYLRFGPNNRIF